MRTQVIVETPSPTTSDRCGMWDRLGQRLREAGSEKTRVPGSLTEFLDGALEEKPEEERSLPGLYSIINQSVAIFIREILRLKLMLWPADLVVQPDFPRDMSCLSAEEGILAGAEAMEQALPELRAIIFCKHHVDLSDSHGSATRYRDSFRYSTRIIGR